MSPLLALAAAAAVVFVLSWAGNSQTEEGNASFLGMEEGDWRAFLNPVFVVWLAGLWALRGAVSGRLAGTGLWLALAGVTALLVGNVLEFGPLGEPFLPESPPGSGSWSPGWAPMLLGAPVALAGLVLVGVGAAQGRLA